PAPAAVSPEDFYKENTIALYTNSSPGSSADMYARALAAYLPEATGGTVIVKNLTDAAGTVLYNNMYNGTFKPDGLTLMSVPTGSVWSNFAHDSPGVAYTIDTFEYLGAAQEMSGIFTVPAQPPYNSLEALQNAKEELKFVAMGKSSRVTLGSVVTIELFNLNAKIVTGFKGGPDRMLAMVQGEAQGCTFPAASAIEYDKAGKLKILFAVTENRDALLPDVPSLNEFIEITDYHRLLLTGLGGNCYFVAAPPGTPKDRVDFLQAKVAETMDMPAYQKVIGKLAAWGGMRTPEDLAEEAARIMRDKPKFAPIFKDLIAKYIM
ncbi:tripartite tricarboxylate transporter substrate-binding protein, partial [Chloroflexota bacterium]